MTTPSRPALTTLMLATVGVMAITAIAASAQSSSPFARKNKPQAWETPAAPQTQPPAYQAPTYQAPSYQAPRTAVTPNYRSGAASTYQSAPSNTASNYQSPSPAPSAGPYAAPSAAPSAEQTYGTYQAPTYQAAPATPAWPAQDYTGQNYSGQHYSGQSYKAPTQPAAQTGHYYPGRDKAPAPQGQYGQYNGQQAPSYQNQNYQNHGYQNRGYNAPPQTRPPKQGWKDRLGLGNLATTLSGFLKIGAAGTYLENDANTITSDDFREDFIADGMVRGEVSAITQGGLEYGVGAELSGQYDKYRRGFGGRIGDCPPAIDGCGTVDVAGVPTAVRGHTSGFYAAGSNNDKDFEVALEGAYLFLRSAYGDITIGRDDGAAYLFSLGAPSLVAVNASNSPVDYTGLDSVKTVNDASGFSEKIAYVSPRLLGDQIGVGVQIGASYAPNARACGVDYCVRRNGRDGSGALAPDLENVIELGLSLDRKFDNGLSVEATASYATASEQSGLAPFDDLQSFGAGLEFALKSWRLGGSYLKSNNGLQNGDYTAYDMGLSYKPGRWGVSASYGHAKDDNVLLTSNQGTLGFVYDINERFTLGTGVQYVERRVPGVTTINGAETLTRNTERAASVFVEGGVTF